MAGPMSRMQRSWAYLVRPSSPSHGPPGDCANASTDGVDVTVLFGAGVDLWRSYSELEGPVGESPSPAELAVMIFW